MSVSKSNDKFKAAEDLEFLDDYIKDDIYVKFTSKIHKNKAYWSGQAVLRKYETE